MPVRIAKTAGFCWGVKRAMEMALEAVARPGATTRTFGPLIHNRQAVETLRSKGIEAIDAVDEAAERMSVIIRAHGVAPDIREALESRGAEIHDATCPNVIRAQRLVERFTKDGHVALIVGDRDHAETIGILGHAQGPAYVVESAAQVEAAPGDFSQVVVVAQTTQERERFEEVARRVRERWPEAVIHDTVCSDASNRQKELRELAREVDAMVVVGGRHSANTNRLAQVSREMDVPTWLVETAEDLDAEALAGFNDIGVTGGASTPDWVIDEVVKRLEALQSSQA